MLNSNKGNLYANISYPLSKGIIESTNNPSSSSPFFDNYEETILSMLIFYCKEFKNKTSIKTLLYEVNALLTGINSISDFHKLFMCI